MRTESTRLPEVLLIEPAAYGDARGMFFESFNRRAMADIGIDLPFVQDNHSISLAGVVRGLHYQLEQAQGKLVRAVVGEVFDVAVDIRRSSPRFGQWTGHRLSAGNRTLMWVPPGFAHGFLVLSERAEVLYKTTDYYGPQFERSIAWNDPQIAIDWPLSDVHPSAAALPVLSARDLAGRPLREAETYP
ncbi:MAG: dTDP-4-dehydrorhamnose 3,5-epimerase [bacterium]|jgi:dTDP-4-dehydrorhamnose 3,5-epimerase|nr:dTDP-4-dehydrorhamnose 3,5-epimerase [Betaproteobacteria bacterium]